MSYADLAKELTRLREDPSNSAVKTPADRFVLWFVGSYLSNEDFARARAALTGEKGDRGLDAVHIDDDNRLVALVQGKLRERLMAHSEPRDVVNSFAGYARLMKSNLAELRAHCDAAHMSPRARTLLEMGHDRLVRRRGYRLQLCYATLGRFTGSVQRSARARVSALGAAVELELFDGDRVMGLLENYLDGVGPMDSIDLPVAAGATGSSSTLMRSEAGLESWVLTVAADDIAALVDKYGDRLFARNVRGVLDPKGSVNASLESSIKERPDLFWYRNNGVTILCDRIESQKRTGLEFVRLENAQIINGQQTTMTLRRVAHQAGGRRKVARANVLVRVIRVPPLGPHDLSYDDFVSSVVKASNWQNKIAASDLVSNAKLQVDLERQLRPFGFEYLRKQGGKVLARRQNQTVRGLYITKFELAQAVAACAGLPVMRIGREPLFEDPLYTQVFSSHSPYFYITRYWIAAAVEAHVRGSGERRSLKWPVVSFLWDDLGREIVRRADRFHDGMSLGKDGELQEQLKKMIAKMDTAGYAFYTAYSNQPIRKKRSEQVDGRSPEDQYDRNGAFKTIPIDDFFKRPFVLVRGRFTPPQVAMMQSWNARPNSGRRRAYESARREFLSLLDRPAGRSAA